LACVGDEESPVISGDSLPNIGALAHLDWASLWGVGLPKLKAIVWLMLDSADQDDKGTSTAGFSCDAGQTQGARAKLFSSLVEKPLIAQFWRRVLIAEFYLEFYLVNPLSSFI
jgi:hypothetical protein